uniref:Uncharacterized protein n=1 Tax=Arundo donax TaxID=35708 RepID=A0A0A9A066_ARUDO
MRPRLQKQRNGSKNSKHKVI